MRTRGGQGGWVYRSVRLISRWGGMEGEAHHLSPPLDLLFHIKAAGSIELLRRELSGYGGKEGER